MDLRPRDRARGARNPAHPEHGRVHYRVGQHELWAHRRDFCRGVRGDGLRVERLASLDQRAALARCRRQDHDPTELPHAEQRRGHAPLLSRQLPAREGASHVPRLLRRRSARVVPRVGRRPRRADDAGNDASLRSPQRRSVPP